MSGGDMLIIATATAVGWLIGGALTSAVRALAARRRPTMTIIQVGPEGLVIEGYVTAETGGTPTPADVASTSGRTRPVWFFDHHRADPAVPETPAQRRARLRDDVSTNAERFMIAAHGLRCSEADLDLALALYSRALARLDAATGAFDYELGKSATPTPHIQHRNL